MQHSGGQSASLIHFSAAKNATMSYKRHLLFRLKEAGPTDGTPSSFQGCSDPLSLTHHPAAPRLHIGVSPGAGAQSCRRNRRIPQRRRHRQQYRPSELGCCRGESPARAKRRALRDDGIASMGGATRPSPRAVSNAFFAQAQPVFSSAGHSDFIWAWGQFLDHDLGLTPGANEFEPIPVPQGDSFFDPFDTGTQIIPFQRSVFDTASTPRQQLNLVSAYIDGKYRLWLKRRHGHRPGRLAAHALRWPSESHTYSGRRPAALQRRNCLQCRNTRSARRFHRTVRCGRHSRQRAADAGYLAYAIRS